jgi:anthranilate phosphoribosyltransferase
LGAATLVGELKHGEITEYELHPEDFGFQMSSNRALRVETPEQSKAMLLGVLDNSAAPELKPAKDIVLLNTAAALYAANVVDSIKAGVGKARGAIESGAAKAKLDGLIAASKG